jgi:hypothetical protein
VILPDLRTYRLHRVLDQAAFEGTPVPGMRAEFFHRDEAARTASVGRYSYGGKEILLAWGFTDEEHCRYSAVRDADDRWRPPTAGCPRVRILRDGTDVTGIQVGDGSGGWLICRDGTVTAAG